MTDYHSIRDPINQRTTAKGKPFLGVRYVNCLCYGRLYMNDDKTAYLVAARAAGSGITYVLENPAQTAECLSRLVRFAKTKRVSLFRGRSLFEKAFNDILDFLARFANLLGDPVALNDMVFNVIQDQLSHQSIESPAACSRILENRIAIHPLHKHFFDAF